MKIGKIASEAFIISFNKLMKQKIPVKTAMKLREIAKLLGSEGTKYDEVKTVILERYALKNEDGTIKSRTENGRTLTEIDLKHLVDFNKEMKELSELEIDVPIIFTSELYNKNENDDDNSLCLIAEDYANLEFIKLPVKIEVV